MNTAVTTSVTSSLHRIRMGNIEPALALLLRQSEPLAIPLMLFICTHIMGLHFLPVTAAYAMLIYITAGQLIDLSGSKDAAPIIQGRSLDFLRVAVQWATVVTVLSLVSKSFPDYITLPGKIVLPWFLSTPMLLWGSYWARRVLVKAANNGAAKPRYVIIGVNEVGYELANRLTRVGFLGYFDFRSAQRVAENPDGHLLAGHCRDIQQFILEKGVRTVYIALPISKVPRMMELINCLRDTTVSVYFVPDAFSFDPIQGRMVEINGMPALSICDTPFQGINGWVKRAMDIVAASLGLIVFSPIMLAVAIAVKWSSPGPILFRQRRYGLNGEEIKVCKFRSMTTTDDGASVEQAHKNDKRVTKVGQFIRKTSLDELPQLFNVLIGSMSLVGPRPHAVAHNEMYRKLINGYMIRHKVKPGITGLAQVKGMRGETETVEKMEQRVKYDLEYLRHWSTWLDLRIIARTFLVLIKDKNAY